MAKKQVDRFSKNFTTKDFPIGQPWYMLIRRLQRARDLFGKPIRISSGGRTRKHNKTVGGKKNSSHIVDFNGYFYAADIRCQNDKDRFVLLNILFLVGFKRIGVYDKHLHVDVDMSKNPIRLWVEKSK